MALPDKIPIDYVPYSHSWCIGHYDDGQFLGFVVAGLPKDYQATPPEQGIRREFLDHQRIYAVLHLFDHDGRYRSTDLWYAGTGQGEPVQRAFARLQLQVDALPGRAYGDIAIGLFHADVEVDDLCFELVDESDEECGDWAELYPNCWGFHPPWDGGYDT
jgi:hypothetical protein